MFYEKKVSLIQNGNVLKTAHQADIREMIEDMLLEKIGFTPALQEDAEDDYVIYLHTDSYDDLSEDQLQTIEDLGITEDGDETTENIKNMFNVDFKIEGDWTIE